MENSTYIIISNLLKGVFMKCSFPLKIKKKTWFIFKRTILVPCGNCYYCKKSKQDGLYQYFRKAITFENLDLSIKDLSAKEYIEKYVK